MKKTIHRKLLEIALNRDVIGYYSNAELYDYVRHNMSELNIDLNKFNLKIINEKTEDDIRDFFFIIDTTANFKDDFFETCRDMYFEIHKLMLIYKNQYPYAGMEFNIRELMDGNTTEIEEKLRKITKLSFNNYQTHLENYRKQLLKSNILNKINDKYYFNDKISLAIIYIQDTLNVIDDRDLLNE